MNRILIIIMLSGCAHIPLRKISCPGGGYVEVPAVVGIKNEYLAKSLENAKGMRACRIKEFSKE